MKLSPIIAVPICLWLAAAAPQDPQASVAAEVAVFDRDPAHPFNRLHAALLVRRGPDGTIYGVDRLDPLLWAGSTHLLDGESHRRALAALATFAGEAVDASPLQRALLQRDLWSVFDWAGDLAARPVAEQARRLALCRRLVAAIARTTLTSAEIAALPDTYAHGAGPADLFDADGPWVRVESEDDEPVAPLHALAFPRSVFSTFVRLPTGRAATLAYLESLRDRAYRQPAPGRDAGGTRTEPDPATPQFPVGTQWALLRRAIVLDRDLQPVPTALVESLQLRTYTEIAAGTMLLHNEPERTQRFAEWTLQRAPLLAGGAGLVPTRADDRDFLHVQFASHGWDPFAAPQHFAPPSTSSLQTCGICHRDPGVHSVRVLAPNGDRPGFLRLRAAVREPAAPALAALAALQRSFSYGLLRGLAAE